MPADSRRKGRRRTRTPSPSNTLNEILKRLQDLEERARGSELLSASVVTPEPCRALTMPSTPLPAVEPATTPACAPPASAQDVAATSTPAGNDAKSVAERFLDAIIQFPVAMKIKTKMVLIHHQGLMRTARTLPCQERPC
ncbi:unnamed protein product, partial [Brenthis ino]